MAAIHGTFSSYELCLISPPLLNREDWDVTIFSLIEIALAGLGVYVLFGLDEIRLAGRRLRGQGMAYIGILLFTPLPFALLIGSTSGAATHLTKQAARQPWETVYAEAVEQSWWLDPAGIAVSVSLIALVFLIFGKPDERKPDSEESLARDGWQDPPDWQRRAAALASEPLPVERPKPPEAAGPPAGEVQASENGRVPADNAK